MRVKTEHGAWTKFWRKEPGDRRAGRNFQRPHVLLSFRSYPHTQHLTNTYIIFSVSLSHMSRGGWHPPHSPSRWTSDGRRRPPHSPSRRTDDGRRRPPHSPSWRMAGDEEILPQAVGSPHSPSRRSESAPHSVGSPQRQKLRASAPSTTACSSYPCDAFTWLRRICGVSYHNATSMRRNRRWCRSSPDGGPLSLRYSSSPNSRGGGGTWPRCTMRQRYAATTPGRR
jgi:hypothetical protein